MELSWLTALKSDAIEQCSRPSKYSSNMTAVHVKIISTTSSVRSKDSALVRDESQLINKGCTFTKDSNDLLSIVDIDVYYILCTSTSTMVTSCMVLTIGQLVCNLNSINQLSCSYVNSLYKSATVVQNLIEWRATTSAICKSRKCAAIRLCS